VETLKEEREELRRVKEEKEVVEREVYALRDEMRRRLGDWVGMLRLNGRRKTCRCIWAWE